MATIAQSGDGRFDEAEADVERGDPWAFRDADATNPLTIQVTGWSTGHTKFGDTEFLSGVDRDGRAWSILVGSVVLKKRLIEGLVEEWDDEEGKFVVTETLGRVQVGEIISVKYTGDGETATGNSYPRFVVSRKPAPALQGGGDDDVEIPY